MKTASEPTGSTARGSERLWTYIFSRKNSAQVFTRVMGENGRTESKNIKGKQSNDWRLAEEKSPIRLSSCSQLLQSMQTPLPARLIWKTKKANKQKGGIAFAKKSPAYSALQTCIWGDRSPGQWEPATVIQYRKGTEVSLIPQSPFPPEASPEGPSKGSHKGPRPLKPRCPETKRGNSSSWLHSVLRYVSDITFAHQFASQ